MHQFWLYTCIGNWKVKDKYLDLFKNIHMYTVDEFVSSLHGGEMSQDTWKEIYDTALYSEMRKTIKEAENLRTQ